jgi:uncharacterized heparinase superfamily protein
VTSLYEAGRLWRTVRHLKVRQVVGRAVFRLRYPTPDLRPAPPLRPWHGPWVLPSRRAHSLIGPRLFRFLNVEGDLDEIGWCGAQAEKLWRYNQHYFDDLNAYDAPHRRVQHQALLARWLADNPPGQGVGWEPYPTSLRIVNVLKAAASGWGLPPAVWHSLAVQTRWLRQRLEWHLLGNHLFVNAKALVLAGLAFEGDEARAWLSQGIQILQALLPEQVLPDGGQFERSPMYHALALEDLLDLRNAAQAARHPETLRAMDAWQPVTARMLRWLQAMTHPDGRLARFNDSAHGIAPDNDELYRYAEALGLKLPPLAPQGLLHLPDSGYVRVDRGPAVAFLDVAEIAPDYLPSHAHGDSLSFELSVHGLCVVTNGGTSCYGTGARRLQERGTALHSTVQVAGANSSEVWSSFRVGRRARPRDLQVSADYVCASHDGYRSLPGRPLHRREWRFGAGTLDVEDTITAERLPAVARYHLAPGLSVQPVGEQTWRVAAQDRVLANVEVLNGHGALEPSSFAPEFGVVLPTQCLAVQCAAGRALTRWTWA